ncbi:PRELI domain-containing protein 2 [Holothuria leucospilota]|uniref:PRELI domain-containing protein 2 n=1 Tax=Holothuria leucospilota TaxID=206669 RepID=A0A9Q1BTN0_HOLLE|nr:PRELI domain-containing protein 2 [Holothuria leucospilota]
MMKVKSRNITWDRYAAAWEESEFKCNKENPNWTSMDQRGGVHLKYFGPIARMAEMFIYSYVKTSSWKAVHVMEELLEERAESYRRVSGSNTNFKAEQTAEAFS